jgi:hypothetical protein
MSPELLADGASERLRVSAMRRHVLGSAIDALMIGVGGGVLYWLLWHPSVRTAVFVAVIGGVLTAALMRVGGRHATPGDQLLRRLVGPRQ